MNKHDIGVEDVRTTETKLGIINSKLDLFEILLLSTYINKKYSDDSVGVHDVEEISEDEIEPTETIIPGTSAIDYTLNLDNDYFRALRIDKNNTHRYSFITQVDFDNIVIDEENLSETKPEFEALIQRIKDIGEGNQKAEAEKKYLYNGGKGPETL